MSNLSAIVNVTIQTVTAGTPRESFGFPLILAPNASWTERTRQYTSEAGIAADGFSSTGPEYLAAQRMFAQTPKPSRVVLGRCSALQQKFRLTPVNFNLLVYSVAVDGQTASYTADSSATVAEITAGLKTAIDALSIAGCTTTDNTTSLDIAFTSGTFHSVVVAPSLSGRSSGPMSVAETTTDPGLSADLDAICVENNSWYGLQSCYRSKTIVDNLATWTESNKKLFVVQTVDSQVMNTPISGTDDVGESTKASTWFRTSVHFHEDPKALLDAALLGKLLPYDVGTEKWNLINVAGPQPSALTATQKANLAAKLVTYYTTMGAVNVTSGGKVASGEWTDQVRLQDGIKSDVEVSVGNLLTQDEKVAYTDSGISKVGNAIRNALLPYTEGDAPAIVPGSVKVTLPKAAAISSTDKLARDLTGVKFDALRAGAIYLTHITGTLAV